MSKAVADYQGTILKRLGDGAMAIFTTATDAIAAGAAIQTRLAAKHARRPHRCTFASASARVRSCWRRATCEGFLPLKPRACPRVPKAVRSSRPSSSTSSPRRAARPASVPLGAFDLKGLPGPTPLYEVSWPINGDETVPLPESLDIAAHEFAFVGRTREVAVLVEQWDATRATTRAVVGHRDG